MDAKLTPSSITAQTPKVDLVIDVPSAMETESGKEESLSFSSSLSLPPTNVSKTKTPIGNLILSNCHVGYFKISLSLSSQALLWKTLINFNHDRFYANPMQYSFNDDEHVYGHNNLPFIAFVVLWSLALFTLVATAFTYLLKSFLQFHTVKQEFFNHVSMNYFFAPSTSALLLLQASPFFFPTHLLWWPLALPILILDIRIYGEWFTKGKRFLSRVANPASQLSIIANLVAAKAYMDGVDDVGGRGFKDVALCMFAIGMAHYLVLFVTLYQRLPGGDGLPLILRPVFFLFVATPSVASLAWASVNGSFDVGAKMMFFLSLFFFISLVCRPNLFKNSMNKFSAAWWAYCFSLTLLAMASIEYAKEVKAGPEHVIMLALSVVSILVLFVLLIFTVINIDSMVFGRVIEHDDDESSSTPDSSVDDGNGGGKVHMYVHGDVVSV